MKTLLGFLEIGKGSERFFMYNVSERVIFSGDSLNATGYVYNNTASSNDEAGWHSCRVDDVVIQIGCSTLTDLTVTYRVEGRLANKNRIASLTIGTISVAKSIDETIVVSEKMREIRVGARLNTVPASPLASPNNLYCSIGLTERR